jgi:hypothetical protein
MEMKTTIKSGSEVPEDMCRRVINHTLRVAEVAKRIYGHIEHLIHRGQPVSF